MSADEGDGMGGVLDEEDFLDSEPSRQEKVEMRKAIKSPSEWLRLLCKSWALENEAIVDTTDVKFIEYKPYAKGMLSSQLLCRLSIPMGRELGSPSLDFWETLGVDDEFDRAFIVSQVERFCVMYSIRAVSLDDDLFAHDLTGADPTALAAAAAGMNVSPGGSIHGLGSYMDQSAATAAAAAAAASVDYGKKQIAEVSKAHRIAKDAEKALEHERRENKMREQRRLTQERKEQKARDREALAVRKAHERAAREASREEKKRKRSEIRVTRERFVLQQKEAALQRAAELVASNRVPIEITRGAAAAKAAANAALVAGGAEPEVTQEAKKRGRSAIIVSTASDLHRIVTHSKNLWAKYNAIAREHNQKVSWATVAKELGIHVKVREKYSRMHSRAVQRGFDWIANGDWKIKDHPEIFMEPTAAEQKARMPLPPPDESTTVLIDGDSKEVTDEAVAAAAAAVRIVDASVVGDAHVDEVVHTTEEQTAAAAAVAATFVSDPTVKFDSTLSLDV